MTDRGWNTGGRRRRLTDALGIGVVLALAKNRAQLFTLFALGNLSLVRRKLMA